MYRQNREGVLRGVKLNGEFGMKTKRKQAGVLYSKNDKLTHLIYHKKEKTPNNWHAISITK